MGGRIVSAQPRLIDSLKTALRQAQSDATRVNLYYDIANAFYKKNQTVHHTVVNMRDYLDERVHSLMDAYGYRTDGIRLQLDVEEGELDVDVAIPIGLIINELVSNAFKHTYQHQPDPLLRIGLRQETDPSGAGITLEVQDNGTGTAPTDWQTVVAGRSSFGRRLIASLSEQLNGQFELLNENGTRFRLYIPKPWSIIASGG